MWLWDSLGDGCPVGCQYEDSHGGAERTGVVLGLGSLYFAQYSDCVSVVVVEEYIERFLDCCCGVICTRLWDKSSGTLCIKLI